MSAPAADPQAAFAAALLDPALPCPPGLRSWNGADPAARFAVYRNNVANSLIDALGDSFPVLAQLVGEAFFRAMALCFVRCSPPRSKVLARYGEGFADFVRSFPPAASLPYLADVARLEYARVQAYHAADAEALPRSQLAAALADAERAATARLQLHPSLHCLRGEFAAVSLWAAHQGWIALQHVDPLRREHALIWRNGLDVELCAIDDGQQHFVQQLLHGQALGLAAAAALQQAPSFDLGAGLAQLIGAGLITHIHHPTPAP